MERNDTEAEAAADAILQAIEGTDLDNESEGSDEYDSDEYTDDEDEIHHDENQEEPVEINEQMRIKHNLPLIKLNLPASYHRTVEQGHITSVLTSSSDTTYRTTTTVTLRSQNTNASMYTITVYK